MPETARADAAPAASIANLQPATPPRQTGWPMTAADVALVRASFRLLAQDMDRCAELFYARLVTLDPDIRQRQQPVAMPQQRRHLIQILIGLIDLLDQPMDLQKRLGMLAREHAVYGSRDRKVQTAKAAFAWTIDRLLEPAGGLQHAAWMAALEMVGTMLDGIHNGSAPIRPPAG